MRTEQKWLRGHCWDMAIALHEATSLPLYGLFDDGGDCHHAYVWDEALEKGIDARGLMSIDALSKGCAGNIPGPLDRGDIEGLGGWLGRPLHEDEIKEASRYVKKAKVLAPWLAASALRGSERKKRATPGR